jgi:hypothetical protein
VDGIEVAGDIEIEDDRDRSDTSIAEPICDPRLEFPFVEPLLDLSDISSRLLSELSNDSCRGFVTVVRETLLRCVPFFSFDPIFTEPRLS